MGKSKRRMGSIVCHRVASFFSSPAFTASMVSNSKLAHLHNVLVSFSSYCGLMDLKSPMIPARAKGDANLNFRPPPRVTDTSSDPVPWKRARLHHIPTTSNSRWNNNLALSRSKRRLATPGIAARRNSAMPRTKLSIRLSSVHLVHSC